MKKPLIAIVGRPNVGKSTFFNRVVGRRISIVKDEPGVTRDRIYADAEWLNYKFTLIDTGGIDFSTVSPTVDNIIKQAYMAIDLADVVLFMVDGREGITANDMEVASFLRKQKKPVILAVNKLDNNEVEKSFEFYELGLGTPFVISAEQSKGIGDLLDEVVKNFDTMEDEGEEKKLKIAIVGKPNVGKSSITNRILGEERVVVSEVAGTTRDAIDTPFTYNGKDYVVIDTAGMRRKRSIEYESIEQYSVIRSIEAIRRADIVLIVFDASEPLSEQDIRVAGIVHEEQKPSVIIVNKWDSIEKDTHTIELYNAQLKEDLAFMDYFVPVYISAKTGKNFSQVMESAIKVYENATRRISTSIVNELLQDAIRMTQPPSRNGRRCKFYYASQVSVLPPTFVFQTNDAELVHFSYQRYLENTIRRNLDFSGTPIKMIFRSKNEKE